MLFTKTELIKPRRGIQHPNKYKLINPLKHARPDEFDAETKNTLGTISRICDTFQHVGSASLTFKISLSTDEGPGFNDKLCMHLIFPDVDAVFHIADTAACFSEATFPGKTTHYSQSIEEIWLSLLEAWCAQYSGFSKRLRTAAGTVFTSPGWGQILSSCRTRLRVPVVEVYSSLSIGQI